MKKLNRKVNQKLIADNVIRVTETYNIPRYRGEVVRDDDICDTIVEDLKAICPIYILNSYFNKLTSVELDEDELFSRDSLKADLNAFQKYLDKEYPRYEAYVLGAYIHSGVSFSYSKEGDKRCPFDSVNLGFIGFEKGDNEEVKQNIIDTLNKAWNGDVYEYCIIDNLTEDVVDSVIDVDVKDIDAVIKQMQDEYGVTFEEKE